MLVKEALKKYHFDSQISKDKVLVVWSQKLLISIWNNNSAGIFTCVEISAMWPWVLKAKTSCEGLFGIWT